MYACLHLQLTVHLQCSFLPPAGCALQMRQLHLTPTAINKQTAKLRCRQRQSAQRQLLNKQIQVILSYCSCVHLRCCNMPVNCCCFVTLLSFVFLFILLDNRSSVRAPKCQQCRYCPILWHLHTFVACNYTIIYVMRQLAKLFTQMKQ